MKHQTIELPLGDAPNGGSPGHQIPHIAEGETGAETGAEICEEWLRIFGVPSPICPDDPPPVSARILADLQSLRERHVQHGHTPASDARHTDLHFTMVLNEFLRRARTAKRPGTRRKNLVVAAGVLVAWIDADDYRTTHQNAPAEGTNTNGN